MKIIGHRGARHLRPENTIASINKAIQHHVDAVEIDIRMTKDKVAVLHHDEFLVEPDGAEISISRNTYAQLLKHKPDLAPLDHAIRIIGHRCSIIIEIKPGVNPTKTIEIIRYYLAKGWRLDEFAIASFDFKILQQVKNELPHITLVVNEKWSSIRARYRANKLGTRRIAMTQTALWIGLVKALYRSDWQVSSFPAHLHSREIPRSWHRYMYATTTDRPQNYHRI